MARVTDAVPYRSDDVHESTTNRIVTSVENLLVWSGEFSLPKRRKVEETQWSVVLIDVIETPVERPKKSKNATTAARSDVTA